VTHAPNGLAGPQRRRAMHLLDPENPRPRQQPRGGMTLTTVQMWVLSTLAVSTVLHFAGGLVAAAWYVGESRPGARAGLLGLAGVSGILAVAAGRAIHRKPLLSPWLLLGALPSLVGAWFVF